MTTAGEVLAAATLHAKKLYTGPGAEEAVALLETVVRLVREDYRPTSELIAKLNEPKTPQGAWTGDGKKDKSEQK
jgi:hypothetical protein